MMVMSEIHLAGHPEPSLLRSPPLQIPDCHLIQVVCHHRGLVHKDRVMRHILSPGLQEDQKVCTARWEPVHLKAWDRRNRLA